MQVRPMLLAKTATYAGKRYMLQWKESPCMDGFETWIQTDLRFDTEEDASSYYFDRMHTEEFEGLRIAGTPLVYADGRIRLQRYLSSSGF